MSASSSAVLQEQFWRSVLFHNHYSFLSSSGYDISEEAQNQSQKEQQELLMKMFAVSMSKLSNDDLLRPLFFPPLLRLSS